MNNREHIILHVKDLMQRHEDLDWTMAVQAVAMQIGENEQELLEDLRKEFEDETS